MGLEVNTTAQMGRRKFDGKLHVDSKSLQFRGDGFRWEVPLGKQTTAKAQAQTLIVRHADEVVRFAVGEKAGRWVEKIQNPPSRMTKLHVQNGQRVWISKGFDRAFLNEVKSTGAIRTTKLDACELAIWKVPNKQTLIEFEQLIEPLPAGVNLWIVWPKGSASIRQADVMEEARRLGFGPSKTAAFDDEHSSMRFARKAS